MVEKGAALCKCWLTWRQAGHPASPGSPCAAANPVVLYPPLSPSLKMAHPLIPLLRNLQSGAASRQPTAEQAEEMRLEALAVMCLMDSPSVAAHEERNWGTGELRRCDSHRDALARPVEMRIVPRTSWWHEVHLAGADTTVNRHRRLAGLCARAHHACWCAPCWHRPPCSHCPLAHAN